MNLPALTRKITDLQNEISDDMSDEDRARAAAELTKAAAKLRDFAEGLEEQAELTLG